MLPVHDWDPQRSSDRTISFIRPALHGCTSSVEIFPCRSNALLNVFVNHSGTWNDRTEKLEHIAGLTLVSMERQPAIVLRCMSLAICHGLLLCP